MKGLKKLLLLPAMALVFTGCNKYYPELEQISEDMNKQCPMQIDADTRIDSTSVSDTPLKINYYYTVVGFDKEQDQLPAPLEDIKKDLQAACAVNLDTVEKMKSFRKNHVTLHYHYKDNKGRNLFDFTVKSEK